MKKPLIGLKITSLNINSACGYGVRIWSYDNFISQFQLPFSHLRSFDLLMIKSTSLEDESRINYSLQPIYIEVGNYEKDVKNQSNENGATNQIDPLSP